MTKPILIIAEAGVNHNGKLSLAKKLIDVASDAGADLVNFKPSVQTVWLPRRPKKQIIRLNWMEILNPGMKC